MLTTNEIKYKIQKYMPKVVFETIYFIWTKIILKIFNFYNSIRLHFFRKEFFKTFSHDGVTFDICISPDNGTVDDEIYLHSVYEPYFLSRIKRELREGDVFVDIGANIGQHSLFASAVIGESGKAIAFEPIPRIHNQFKSSIMQNIKAGRDNYKNISLYNLGCGGEDKTLNIYSTSDNMGGSSVVNISDRVEVTEIKIVRADEVIKKELEEKNTPSPSSKKRGEKLKNNIFIKIDVEGYEYEALMGLQETIEKYNPKIFLEYSLGSYTQQSMAENQNTPNPSLENRGKLILDNLLDHGYTIYDLEDNDKILDKNSFDNFIKNKIEQTNLLCIYKK